MNTNGRKLKHLEERKTAPLIHCSLSSFKSFYFALAILGRFLCDESGVDSSKFTFDFSGNEIKALQSLIRTKCDLLFMLKKTYEGLSSFSHSNVRKLDESVTDFACHLFCVAPHLKDQSQALVDVLMAMENDEQGKEILKDIQIQGWTKSEAGELKMLQMVYDRYVK